MFEVRSVNEADEADSRNSEPLRFEVVEEISGWLKFKKKKG